MSVGGGGGGHGGELEGEGDVAMQVGSRMQRSGRLLPDGETSMRPQPVGRRGPGRGVSRLTSRPSAMTVTSLG